MEAWANDEGDHNVNLIDRYGGTVYAIMKANYPSRVYPERDGVAYVLSVSDRLGELLRAVLR
jgi:hypothetical protein